MWKIIEILLDIYLVIYWVCVLAAYAFSNYQPSRGTIAFAFASAVLLWTIWLFSDIVEAIERNRNGKEDD